MEKLKRENLNKLMRNTYIKSIDLFSLIKNDNIFKILNLAEKNNFNIWIVGGALRDFFLKKNINDFDFVYDIQPLELVEILKTNKLDFISSYINFGVIILKLNNKKRIPPKIVVLVRHNNNKIIRKRFVICFIKLFCLLSNLNSFEKMAKSKIY